MTPSFIDTNVLVYGFSDDERAVVAQDLVSSGCVLSVQSLNEFTTVCRRNLGFDWPQVHRSLAMLREGCRQLVPVDEAVHQRGLQVSEAYGYSLYDALLLAAALEAGCTTFWSEDLQDEQVVEGTMTIRNPFA